MIDSSAAGDFQLLEQLGAGIVIMDSAGVVVRWNPRAEAILGLPAGAAIGRPWADVLTVIRGAEISGDAIRHQAMKPGGWHGLTNLRIGGTNEVWVRAHVQGLRLSPEDRRTGIVAIFWPHDAAETTNAIEKAQLMSRLEQGLDQERRLTAQLETLMGLTLLPQGEISEEAVAELLLDRIVAALGADSGVVVGAVDGCLRVVARRNMPEIDAAADRVAAGGIVRLLAASRIARSGPRLPRAPARGCGGRTRAGGDGRGRDHRPRRLPGA